MLSIIDRYIGKMFLLYFAAGLVVFVTTFLAVDFMVSMGRHNVGVDVLFKYYGYLTPSIVYQMIPVACLLATVFTLSTLNKSSELVALFSVGMSLARVCAPILTLVAITSALSFWLGDRVLPPFAQKKQYVEYVEIKNKPGLYQTVKTNKIWYRSENVLFNIQTLNPIEKSAQGISLYYFDAKWNLIQLIKAVGVKINDTTWTLSNGSVTLFTEDSSFPQTKTFETKKIVLSEDVKDIQSTANSSDIMSVSQLRKFIQKNKEAGLETLRYEVDYLGKFAFAFAAFVMSLMGIPFSVTRNRSGGHLMNVGICIGFAFLYWTMYASGLTLGRHGVVPPVVAAWGPNCIISIASILLLLRLKK